MTHTQFAFTPILHPLSLTQTPRHMLTSVLTSRCVCVYSGRRRGHPCSQRVWLGGVKKSSPQTNSWDPCSACFLCRSQAVCSLNRPDLSSACGAASVFDCAHASPFTFGERLSGGVGFARRRLCPEPHVLAALIFNASLLFFTNFKSVLSPCVSDPVAFNPEFRDQTRPARQQITLTSQPGEN